MSRRRVILIAAGLFAAAYLAAWAVSHSLNP
jgi:hypothetical protein